MPHRSVSGQWIPLFSLCVFAKSPLPLFIDALGNIPLSLTCIYPSNALVMAQIKGSLIGVSVLSHIQMSGLGFVGKKVSA